ncbi:ATP-binding protein [Geomonas sp. Red32]|uniref:sensor histidine kinase n=1 Tax=Geomonas sp. Red32 TaxID=2912856 RepID=UPI00202CD569|nr:ATP-binding protein [Geomonas sp. Red32]MCM0083547.1 ATP-binding protein [Geomonas sp. Red32]
MHEPLAQEQLLTVGQLALSGRQVEPGTTVTGVYDLFRADPSLEALGVVDGGRPLALITRTKLLFTLSKRFGYELHAKAPIITLADRSPLMVDEGELLDSVVEKACGRAPADVYDEIVVAASDGSFLGLLPLRELIIQQNLALTRSVLIQEVATARSRELERVNQVKAHFLANVTHELRSPINAIVALTHLMKMAADAGSVEQISERLTFLMSTASHLRTVITNILDLSKMEAGKMEVSHKEVEIGPLLEEVAETARLLVGEKPVEVRLAAPDGLMVVTDGMKLRQILLNLAGNAAKFTDRGEISLAAEVAEDELRVTVADTGIGIKDEDLSLLFSAFGQIEDATTKTREGTGLGLAISNQLARLLGGSIKLTSRYGEGTTFTLSLPLTDTKESFSE